MLASGGEDQRVNVWRLRAAQGDGARLIRLPFARQEDVSGASNVWSLAGNSSTWSGVQNGCHECDLISLGPISCVTVDESESQLVSGSRGGVVRLYDLGEGRCA